jgi:hypothetical protein
MREAEEELLEDLGVEKPIPFQKPVAALATRRGRAFRWVVK